MRLNNEIVQQIKSFKSLCFLYVLAIFWAVTERKIALRIFLTNQIAFRMFLTNQIAPEIVHEASSPKHKKEREKNVKILLFFSLLKKSNLHINAGIANYNVVASESSTSSDGNENDSLVI